MTGGLNIRDRERTRFFFFVAVNCLMNVGLTIGLSVSEGLFLSSKGPGPSMLPQVFIVTAVATALTTFVYAAFVDKVRNDRYFQIIHLYAMGALCLILLGIHQELTVAYMAFYGFFYVAQGIFNTHFWNYATDYFDAMEARRLFPFFPLGNSVGGFLGGTLASLAGMSISPLYLASTWILLLLATVVLIQIVSPRLKGWVVMETEETDEASLDNLRQGFNFLRRSAMGGWHIGYAVLMISSLFFLQYLYSAVLARAYPQPEQLTAFIGRFLAITNLVEIVLELIFTPRLIAMAGVGASNAFYPLSTLVGFILIGAFGNVASAIYSRMNRETFENAIASSCRNLLYNAYPTRFRGRIRAFIEGAVTNAGIVVAGLAMMALARTVPPERLFPTAIYVGASFCVAYFCIAVRIRREYLGSLVRGLRDYRLDLDDVSLELDKVKDDDLADMLTHLEGQQDEASVALVSRVFGVFFSRGELHHIVERIHHPNDRVQLAALEVLAQRVGVGMRVRVPEGFDERLRLTLHDVVEERAGHPEVRARALELLARLETLITIASFMQDAEPQVRAAAAAVLVQSETWREPQAAWNLLEQMLAHNDPDVRKAALRRLPVDRPRGAELLLTHLRDENPDVRLAMLDQLERLDAGDATTRRVQPLLSDGSDEVRAGIVRFLGRSRDESILPLLAGRLEDDSVRVRTSAIHALRPWGEKAVPHVRALLDSHSTTSIDAALAVLGGMDELTVRESVREWLERLLEQAHHAVISRALMDTAMAAVTRRLDETAALAMDHALGTTEPLAATALADFVSRVCQHALKGLEFLEDPTVMRNIRRCLETRHRQARGDAMEALSNLGERSISRSLLVLLDDSSHKERMAASLACLGLDRAPQWDETLTRLQAHPDRWIRVASAILADETEPGSGGTAYRQTEEYAVMKNLLFLKKVPLFAQMSLEQLEVISRIVTELSFFKDEVIFKENEIGDKLYVIVEGKVSVVKGHRQASEVVLAALRETDYFGEMSVLDNEPRSASIVVEEDSRLLSISGEKLRDIIQQKPEIAFEIFKVLSARLRKADSKLSELSHELVVLRQHAQ